MGLGALRREETLPDVVVVASFFLALATPPGGRLKWIVMGPARLSLGRRRAFPPLSFSSVLRAIRRLATLLLASASLPYGQVPQSHLLAWCEGLDPSHTVVEPLMSPARKQSVGDKEDPLGGLTLVISPEPWFVCSNLSAGL